MVTIITNQSILQTNLVKFWEWLSQAAHLVVDKKVNNVVSVVRRPSDGATAVLHNERWWTWFLSL